MQQDESVRANLIVEKMESCYKKLLGEFMFIPAMIADFKQWAAQGVVYAGSDGSNVQQLGAHGFSFTPGLKPTKIWGGGAETSGNIEEMSPLRSEHAGSIAIIIILHILQIVTDSDLSVELWVDNAEVLRRTTTEDVSAMALDYDLSHTHIHTCA